MQSTNKIYYELLISYIDQIKTTTIQIGVYFLFKSDFIGIGDFDFFRGGLEEGGSENCCDDGCGDDGD